MKEFLKCKSCGFIIEKANLGEICPACGVSNKMFESYDLKISLKRKKILDLNLHPLLVHFPQAFSFFIMIVSIITYLLPVGLLQNLAYSTISVLAFSLPFFTILTILSGILDGKTRFKRINTLYLKKKIIVGGLFLVSSIILAIFGVFISLIQWSLAVILIFSLLSTLFGGFNGFIGGQLVCTKME